MVSIVRLTAAAVLSISLATACGRDPATSGDAAITADDAAEAKLVASAADLPGCTSAIEGRLVYVRDLSQFQACLSGTWTVVTTPKDSVMVTDEAAGINCPAGGAAISTGTDKNGDNVLDAAEVKSTKYVCSGKNGISPAAVAGPKGDKGDAASPTKIVSATSCIARITTSSAGASGFNYLPTGGLWIYYTATVNSVGDVMATATLSGPSASYSESAQFAAASVGASTGPVEMTYDVAGAATAGYWQMSADRTTNTFNVFYDDGGRTNFTFSGCMTTNY